MQHTYVHSLWTQYIFSEHIPKDSKNWSTMQRSSLLSKLNECNRIEHTHRVATTLIMQQQTKQTTKRPTKPSHATNRRQIIVVHYGHFELNWVESTISFSGFSLFDSIMWWIHTIDNANETPYTYYLYLRVVIINHCNNCVKSDLKISQTNSRNLWTSEFYIWIHVWFL